MASISQLRADISALQGELSAAKTRIAELEAIGKSVVEVPVAMPAEVKIEYRDKIVEIPGPERVVTVEREVVAPQTERVVYVDRVVDVPGPERIVRDDAALDAAMDEIYNLRSRLDVALKSARQVDRVVEYVKIPSDPIEVVKYKDDPAKDAEISRLNAVIDDMRLELMREKQKPPVVEYVDRVVEVPVAMPAATVVEYRDRVVEVSGPERVVQDTVALDAAHSEIEKLKKQLSEERKKKRKVEVKTEYVKLPAKEVEVIKHKDNPAHIKEIKRLTEELTKCQLDLIAEQKKKQEVKFIDRVIENPIPMPQQVKVEYFDRIVETVKYKDNPQLVKMIKELQRKLKAK